MGGAPRPWCQFEVFRTATQQSGLYNLGFQGDMHKWRWSPNTNNFINVRLDRTPTNADWWSSYPRATVCHFPYAQYDHRPILIKINPNSKCNNLFKFRRKKWWQTLDGCSNQTQLGWQRFLFSSSPYNWNLLAAKFINKLFHWSMQNCVSFVGKIKETWSLIQKA